MNKPRYAARIIVGVKSCFGFNWHISDRDKWIMDIYKYQNAYQKIGYKVNMDFVLSLRNNLAIFNESNYIQYLSLNDDEVVSTEELRRAIKCFDKNDTILAYQPSIYVDFIERQLFSMYPENIPFEKYVPDGWKGEFANFIEQIPQSERYWDENGTNLINVIFEREAREFKEGRNNGS